MPEGVGGGVGCGIIPGSDGTLYWPRIRAGGINTTADGPGDRVDVVRLFPV